MPRWRALLVAAQAATILATWPLWQSGEAGTPRLPMIELPAIDAGPVVLITLALTLSRPRVGVWAHAAALGLAIAADQTRLQPSVVSIALLLVATVPRHAALGPAHLAALWTWAGLHKLLSPAFATAAAPAMFGATEAGVGLALVEVALGLAVLHGAARRPAALGALLLHGALAVGLLVRGELALVPWNVVLALAGLTLPAARSRRLDALLLVLPLGFYVGLVDPYLAHVLYTEGVASTVRCGADACDSDVEHRATVAAFGVPLEPTPRLLRAHFEASCDRGDTLFLTGPQTWLHPEPVPSEIPCPR